MHIKGKSILSKHLLHTCTYRINWLNMNNLSPVQTGLLILQMLDGVGSCVQTDVTSPNT